MFVFLELVFIGFPRQTRLSTTTFHRPPGMVGILRRRMAPAQRRSDHHSTTTYATEGRDSNHDVHTRQPSDVYRLLQVLLHRPPSKEPEAKHAQIDDEWKRAQVTLGRCPAMSTDASSSTPRWPTPKKGNTWNDSWKCNQGMGAKASQYR